MIWKILLSVLLAAAGANAATISVTPAVQTVSLGDQATVFIDFRGGFVGNFDLDVSWNPAFMSLDALVFGTQLGGPLDSIQGTAPGAGTVSAFEISLLDVAIRMALQPGQNATLLTLTFNTLTFGPIPVTLAVEALGDENGLPHGTLDVSDGLIHVLHGDTFIPEPATLFMVLPAMGWLARKRFLAAARMSSRDGLPPAA